MELDPNFPIFQTLPTKRNITFNDGVPMEFTVHRGENSFLEISINSPNAVIVEFHFKRNCEIDVTVEKQHFKGDGVVVQKILWVNMPRVANINLPEFVLEKFNNFSCDVVILSATGKTVEEQAVRNMLEGLRMEVIKVRNCLNIDNGFWMIGRTWEANMVHPDPPSNSVMSCMFLGGNSMN